MKSGETTNTGNQWEALKDSTLIESSFTDETLQQEVSDKTTTGTKITVSSDKTRDNSNETLQIRPYTNFKNNKQTNILLPNCLTFFKLNLVFLQIHSQ